jgi:stage V sporulation protein G
MHLSDVRISLCGNNTGRLKAFCCLTFDNTFVIRDDKLIDGNDGLFLAMPSRKLTDHCPHCHEKNHVRARFCTECGKRLDENRHGPQSTRPNASACARYGVGTSGRVKLYADIAHPINAVARRELETRVRAAYHQEVERSRQPGYEPMLLDGEDFDFQDEPEQGKSSVPLRLA